MRRLRRYYVPSGSGVAPHGCGALYKKADVDARIEALEAALAKANAVSDALESLMNEAEVYERFNLNEDTATLTAYRKARDATR